VPYGSKLHIPLANYHLASQQEQSLSLNKKGWRNFYLKKKRERGKKKKEEKEREKIRKKKKRRKKKRKNGSRGNVPFNRKITRQKRPED